MTPLDTPGPERRTVLAAALTTALVTAAGLGGQAEAVPVGAGTPRAAGQGSRETTAPGETTTPREATTPPGAGKAPAGPWDRFNLSPPSRTMRPVAVHGTVGQVDGAANLVKPGRARTRLTGAGSAVTLDFGQEVGGFVTLRFGDGGDDGQRVGLCYAELATYVSVTSSDGSNGGSNNEPPVQYAVSPGGTVSTQTDTPVAGTSATAAATPASQLRGGFRYLTVVGATAGAVELVDVSVHITFAPNVTDLRAYPNYFHCGDESLNRIWYAGAYTVQTNIIAGDQGRVWGPPDVGWNNGATVGEAGGTVLVDGAKRDRTIWPGDLGISVPTDYVSLGDLDTVRNSLTTLYHHQDTATGALPYAGPEVNFIGNSDTYHLWTLIGTATYVQLADDTAWASSVYEAFKKALAYSVAKIDPDGLLNVTSAADWARGDSDGRNIEANAIMYRALITAVALAGRMGDQESATGWAARAGTLKSAVEAAGYWDEAAGLYRDKPAGAGASLHPQDGNALAVWFGLVDSPERAATISEALGRRWTPVGALTPEKGAASVHPFPGGMEVHAHFAAGRASTALDLIRREWGFMLDSPSGTASTFWEGYRTDGTSDYSGSYLSAAHGWATGPTSALTYRLLGIAPAEDGGPGHTVVPYPGDQTFAEGRLTTAHGVITVSWRRGDDGRFDLTISAPAGEVTEIGVPVPERGAWTVRLDDTTVWGDQAASHGARHADGHVRFTGIPAGTHQVTVRPAGE